MSQVHWYVLGAGAMGCLFASALHRAGSPVTLILRQDSVEQTVPVRIERQGTISNIDLPAARASEPGHIGHLLVTTKAADVCSAVLSLAHRLDESSQVLLLANGMGFAEELARALPAPVYYHGTTTEGAYRIDTRHICHAGRGATRIGRPGVTAPPGWFSQWAAAVQPSSWDGEIAEALWLKLAINCAINPLTALHRCRNGALARPDLAREVQKLCEEIAQISAAAGFGASTRDLQRQVAAVIAATAENQSSMLQDAAAGRRTEIDYMTGYLLRVADHHGIAAPHNRALYRSILALDH